MYTGGGERGGETGHREREERVGMRKMKENQVKNDLTKSTMIFLSIHVKVLN